MALRWSDPRWPSAIALVAANLLPVYGLLAWDWPAQSLLALYWAETVVIAAMTLLRILFAHPGSPGYWILKLVALPLLPLLLVPLVLAVFGLAALVFGVFGNPETRHAFVSILFAASDARDLLPPRQALRVLGFGAEPQTLVTLCALAGSHLVSFLWNYLGRGECNRVRIVGLVVLPRGWTRRRSCSCC